MSTVIVAGVDGSAAGSAAMKWAAAEAVLHGAELRLVHAWHPDATATMAGVAVPWLALESEARSQAASWVANAIGTHDENGKKRELEIVQDVAGPALIEAAKAADMLVLGTKVHQGVSRLLQGSVSHYCLNHARCVVVAVPAPAAPH